MYTHLFDPHAFLWLMDIQLHSDIQQARSLAAEVPATHAQLPTARLDVAQQETSIHVGVFTLPAMAHSRLTVQAAQFLMT